MNELLAGIHVTGVPYDVLAELANRLAEYWGAWLFVGKAGAIYAESGGLDHVAFSQFVEEMVESWVADED